MQKLISILVVVAILCAGAWVWILTSETPAIIPVDAPPQRMAAPNADGPNEASTPQAAGSVEPTREPRTGEAPSADAATPTNLATWTLRVVEAETDAPIAGARVWIVPRERLAQPPWPGMGSLVDEPLTILERETPIGTSRADGTIDVAMPAALNLLCAAAPGRFGCESAGAKTSDVGRVHTLRLFRDATLRIEVVDASGTLRPFVPVELVASQPGWPDGARSPVHRVLADAATGVATISHARWRLAGGGHSSFVELGDYAVRVGVSLCKVDAIKIEEKHLAGETMRLVTPPCGPIRVRLLQADRTPWPYEGFVDVKSQGPELDGVGSVPLQNGDALFDAVAVAPKFETTVRARDPRFQAIGLADAGGRTPWVEKLLIAQLPKPEQARPVLAGRVLGVNGEPVTNTEFFVTPIVIDPYVPEYPRFTTSSTGQFEIPYDNAAAPPRRALVRTDPTHGRREYDASERAEFALPVPLALGRHDLGDLRLASTPLLVGGRVVTAQGTPVAEVEISVDLPGDPNSLSSDGRKRQTLEVTTDEDGTFRLCAFDRPAVVRVLARKDETFVPPFDVDRGRDDVVITWPTPTWIRGRLLVDASVPPSELLVHVWRAKNTDGTPTSAQGRALEDGRFEVRVNRSEPCVVRIKKPGTSEVLAEVAEVKPSEVPPGEPFTPSDPRLDPLDLRGRVRRITGIVLDPADEPVAAASVTEPKYGSVLTGADGRFSLITTTPALQLSVSARNYRTVHVTADVNELVVHLRDPRTPVVARMPDGLVLDAFSAIVVWIEDPKLPESHRTIADEKLDGRVATLYVHDLGSYVLRVLTAAKGGFSTPVPGLAIPIEVRDATTIEVVLPITQEQLDAMAKAGGAK